MYKNLHSRLPAAWTPRTPGLVAVPMPQVTTRNMRIHNVAFQNSTYRKVHLEVADIQGLDIVHCVMYPRPEFDLPVLGIDLVERDGRPVFAIADVCPVTDDLSLPDHYLTRVHELQTRLGVTPATRTDMPGWGRPIFSDVCVMTRDVPRTFVEYALELVEIHTAYASTLKPTVDHARVRRNLARFSMFQMRNQKTKAALATEFGRGPAETYMRTVMFDS